VNQGNATERETVSTRLLSQESIEGSLKTEKLLVDAHAERGMGGLFVAGHSRDGNGRLRILWDGDRESFPGPPYLGEATIRQTMRKMLAGANI
jgi:hypothetical protein